MFSASCLPLMAASQAIYGKIETNNFNKDINNEERRTIKKKTIILDQSNLMPTSHKFGFIGKYSIYYNDLEQVKSKTNKHKISFSNAYSFDKNWSAYGSIGMSHESYKRHIVRDTKSDPFHKISNINLGIVYRRNKPFDKYFDSLSKSSSTFNLSLPTSERSRVDKHIANVSLSYFIQTHKWNNFSLFNRLSTNYIWNTQRFSLFLDDQMNRDWLTSNSLGLTYMIAEMIGLRFIYRANMKRYLDGSWNLDFGNNLSLFTQLNNFNFSLSMINNSYQENDKIDLGYYDKYRKTFIGGVTYVF